jgi:hypothetical protein
VQLWPFRLPDNMNLKHGYHSFQGYQAGKEYVAMKIASKGGFYFLSRGHVGISQLGHMGATPIILDEQKLTANIIIHLVCSFPKPKPA